MTFNLVTQIDHKRLTVFYYMVCDKLLLLLPVDNFTFTSQFNAHHKKMTWEETVVFWND